MPTLDQISGAEPSTITFKVRTVTQNQNSTVMHQEVLTLGGTESTLALAAVLDGAPASTAWGLSVRQVGYVAPSTTVSVAAMPAGSTSVTIAAITGPVSTAAPGASDTGVIVRQVGYSTTVSVAAFPANSSQVEVRALPANSSQVEVTNTVTIQGNSTVSIVGPTSTAAPATSDTGVIVRQVGYSTIVSVAAFPANSSQVEVRALPANSSQVEVRNTVTIAGNSTVIIGTNLQSSVTPSSGSSGLMVRQVVDARLTAASTSAFATSTQFTISNSTTQAKYVIGYSITSTDLTATVVRFMGGSTLAWPLRLQATSSAVTGANLAVNGAGYLFKMDAASSATLNISGSSRAGWTVGVSYYLAP